MKNIPQINEVKSATIRRFSETWKQNFLANASAIQRSPGVVSLVKKFRDLPGIVVGAGPSLDKNISVLHQARDQAVIVACDAALKALIQHDIVPPLVVCLDPQEEITKFFTGVSHKGITLVAPTIIHPRVLDVWQGNVVFYNKHAPDIPILTEIQKQLPKVGSLTPGGSVLSVAYHLAYETGCNPIIFIGQDLSYPDEKTYSRSTENREERLDDTLKVQRENIVFEKDMQGEPLPTLKSMAVSKQWFNWAFTTWKRDIPLEIINSSEAGILTEHCTLMPLKEAIFKHCRKKVNVPWILKKALR